MYRRFKLAIAKFIRAEDGVALTEYLVVLGILVGAVIAAVTLYGEALAGVYQSFASFIASLVP
ncbi:MAG: hypothetical protein R3256_13135 [Thalassovita sp.]|nr:hypothetical protein [Thalassovita sp.]